MNQEMTSSVGETVSRGRSSYTVRGLNAEGAPRLDGIPLVFLRVLGAGWS